MLKNFQYFRTLLWCHNGWSKCPKWQFFFKKLLPFRNSLQNGHKIFFEKFSIFFLNIFELSCDVIIGGSRIQFFQKSLQFSFFFKKCWKTCKFYEFTFFKPNLPPDDIVMEGQTSTNLTFKKISSQSNIFRMIFT